MATRRDAALGSITEQTDARQPHVSQWPVICELGDCTDDVVGRVRLETGHTLYLCGPHMAVEPIASAPRRDKDWLNIT